MGRRRLGRGRKGEEEDLVAERPRLMNESGVSSLKNGYRNEFIVFVSYIVAWARPLINDFPIAPSG